MTTNEFDTLFAASADKYGVPFTWLKGIAGAESDWNPNAYRAEPQIDDASRGLMQLLYRTAYGLGFRGAPDDLYDPATNIDLGAALVKQNISRFGMSFERVYSAYNSGSPTAYQTNPDVAAHLARAQRYLAAVEAEVNVVSSDTPAPDGESGAGAAVLLIAIAAGAAAYLFFK